ncbi:hypothetical protein A3D71_01600 [Candidatus Kaiserbacteria bacterium RIFCSPHIGHO2_02_FULL_55_20]|uniref:DUF5667 domain-containing protein n=1 Tax=Candidatus Kaiserbacteria bacterium RIFCSPHIGHO2_02_FULL_55_20 TaxID=1798497 RepID=A0A1F6DXM8_9BACT|nr:MAG: hypothetical protein A2680_01130 [Candidatus Kaiserbacteria bacterium RIFCSPHIGHO2_01_FULL_55_37]OGG66194.1 MAG: hypothetical protein A3D71_01600 [Candidatus Kaiserbacteria bacterium RIFCSPHIGHO2_02_FULL_55_20]
MKKQLVLAAVFSIVFFGFGSSNFALALGEPIPGIDIVVCPSCNITASDLGVDSVGTLPTSSFYFFKEWKRGIARLFTFYAIAKAELELNITNQIAAEVLEVAKTSSAVNYTGLERALQNFTDAQERLRFRITTINGTSNIVDSERFLKAVDEKTAKHAVLLEQLTEKCLIADWDGREDCEVIVQNALNNTQKTFTAAVSQGGGGGTPTGSVNFLRQKAADQIQRTEAAIRESELNYKDVAFTATNWNAPQTVAVSNTDDDSAGVRVTVPKQTQGTTFGEKAKTGDSGNDESDIFDRWGKAIAKAKSHLADAKKAFAEEKYGEAYGLARSAEALAAGISAVNVDGVEGPGKTAPSSSETTSKEKIKISENESPKPETRKPITELDIEDTPTPQTAGSKSATSTEKTEAAQPSGGSAGPASNYDRNN